MHDAGEDISREDAIDLRELREFFRRHRWLIPLTALAIIGLAYFAALAITPKYTSTAKILLQPHRENLFGGETVLKDLSVETSSVDSQILLVSSVNVLRRVVETEQLTEDSEFGGPGKPGIVDTLLEFIGFGSKFEGEQPRTGQRFANPIPPKLLRTISRLEKALEVQRVNRTLVLAVSVTSEDREKAAHLANAIASAYVGDQLDASYEGIKRGSTWLSERLDGLTMQLQKSEEAVALFRKQHNLLSANSSDKSTVSEQQLSELNQKLIEVRAESAEKFAKFKQAAEKVSRGENLEAIPEVVRSNLISDLRKQQAEVSRKEADLAAHRGDRHPLVIDARAERRQIDRAIDAEIKRILANLKNDYNIAHAREVSLEKSLTEVTTQTGLDSETGVRLRQLERINDANKALFENMISRAKITQEQSNFQEQEARIISPATVPTAPSFPKKGLIVSLAGVVGLLLGVGGAVARDMLNSGFSTALEVEEKLEHPVLASLSFVAERERQADGKPLDLDGFVLAKPLSRYSEAIRAIRVGIKMADIDKPPHVILITSSVPEEGKSTVARSLAYSWRRADSKVLLIDADLRRPSISKHFEAKTRPGLVDYLAHGASFDEVTFERDGVWVLPCGSKSSNPPDILGSDRMHELIALCREKFEHVVIDSPPASAVIDPRVLANIVDKTVFVIRWKLTTREIVVKNVEYFMQGRKLAGLILNMVDESKLPRYGAYAQYSATQYNKYYGEQA